MGVEFYVVVRWVVGSFETHQLIFHAGTDENEAKETAKLVNELVSRIGLGLDDDVSITVIPEYMLIHHIHMATKTTIVEPTGTIFIH